MCLCKNCKNTLWNHNSVYETVKAHRYEREVFKMQSYFQYQASCPSCWGNLKSNSKTVAYWQSMDAITVFTVVFYSHHSWLTLLVCFIYENLQGSSLYKKTGPQRNGFLTKFSLRPLKPVSKNMVPSHLFLKWKPRALAVYIMFWESLGQYWPTIQISDVWRFIR